MNKNFLIGKKVLVMGLGRFGGGVDTVKFACRAGAKVTVTDLANTNKLTDSLEKLKNLSNVEFHLGSHIANDFKESDIVIANPAVAADNEYLTLAGKNNTLVTSQINIFFQLCPAKIVGITGANGKSTTTALTAYILKSTIKNGTAFLSGNIGNEPLLMLLDKIKANDIVILELSSFQTEQLARIKKAPQISLLTNLSPNHLDRHGTFENYCQAKENIFKHQKLNIDHPAVSIFNAQDKVGCQWYEKYQTDKGRICLKYSVNDTNKDLKNHFKLPGRANLANLAAAVAISKQFGIEEKQIADCIAEFKPLPHRLELIADSDGIRWYNDSISTTPESSIVALEAFEEPKIIILGGYDKNLPFEKLGKKIAKKAKAAILIGQTAGKIAMAIKACTENNAQIESADTLANAVEAAHKLAKKGDVILLSPACASYDMFDNFQHRGREFIRLVSELKN